MCEVATEDAGDVVSSVVFGLPVERFSVLGRGVNVIGCEGGRYVREAVSQKRPGVRACVLQSRLHEKCLRSR